MHVRQSRSLQHPHPSIPDGLISISADGLDTNVRSPSSSQPVNVVSPGDRLVTPPSSAAQSRSPTPPSLAQTIGVAPPPFVPIAQSPSPMPARLAKSISTAFPPHITNVTPSRPTLPFQRASKGAIDHTTIGLVVSPRLARVSQGGLFTSPSTWRHHFHDDNDTSRVPGTASESIQPPTDVGRSTMGDISSDVVDPPVTSSPTRSLLVRSLITLNIILVLTNTYLPSPLPQ